LATGEWNAAEADVTISACRQICSAELPEDCGVEYFDALCWLASVAAEPIPLPCFEVVRPIYFRAVGIWLLMRSHSPPFLIPRCRTSPPEVGFLPAQSVTATTRSKFDSSPVNGDPIVCDARRRFQEVLESLADDQLDLLGVLI
jgi:hypothetical protein